MGKQNYTIPAGSLYPKLEASIKFPTPQTAVIRNTCERHRHEFERNLPWSFEGDLKFAEVLVINCKACRGPNTEIVTKCDRPHIEHRHRIRLESNM